ESDRMRTFSAMIRVSSRTNSLPMAFRYTATAETPMAIAQYQAGSTDVPRLSFDGAPLRRPAGRVGPWRFFFAIPTLLAIALPAVVFRRGRPVRGPRALRQRRHQSADRSGWNSRPWRRAGGGEDRRAAGQSAAARTERTRAASTDRPSAASAHSTPPRF